MKILFTIFLSLIISPMVIADVVISGIDFSKGDSIQSIIKGVNMVRGSQNAILSLDESRKLIIKELSTFPGEAVTFRVIKNEIVEVYGQKAIKLSRDKFIIRLKGLTKLAKALERDKFPVAVFFDNDVSVVAGHRILKDLYDNGMSLLLYREETREESLLRIERERKIELKSPKSPK